MLDSKVLSDEYPYARVAIKCSGILNDFGLAKLATSIVRVNIATSTRSASMYIASYVVNAEKDNGACVRTKKRN